MGGVVSRLVGPFPHVISWILLCYVLYDLFDILICNGLLANLCMFACCANLVIYTMKAFEIAHVSICVTYCWKVSHYVSLCLSLPMRFPIVVQTVLRLIPIWCWIG